MALNKTDLYIETLMKEFPNKVEWNMIAYNKDISIEFIEKYFDRINKYTILLNKNVQSEHIEKWFLNNEIKDWYSFSQNPNLTDLFIRKHFPNEIYKNHYLYKFIKLSKDEFEDNYTKITDWNTFFRDFKYICELYESIFYMDGWGVWLSNKGFWKEIGDNPNITPIFIKNHSNNINWNKIKWNPHMTKEFIDKYVNKLNWNYFVRDTNIPYEYYADYIDRIDRETFQYIETLPLKYVFTNYVNIGNQDINLEFIEKNNSNIDWFLLSKNTYLPIDVVRKYKKNINWSVIWKNSFENAPDISTNNEIENNQLSNNSVTKQITAYFIPFKHFNMIETVEDDAMRQLYITDISEEIWEFLTKDKKYNIIKTDNGIEIHIENNIIIRCNKIIYNH